MIALVFLALFISTAALAAVPQTLHFSGKLDTGGTGYTGTVSVVFTLYTDPTSTDSDVWTNTQTLSATDGRFQAELTGVTNAILAGGILFLGLQVESDPEMSPRIALRSVPFARQADNALTLEGNAASAFSMGAHTVDTNTTYTGDKGVTLTGTEFSADTSFVQKRVSGTCAAGKSIRVIKADGTVTCETDTDTNTTYDGTNFALSNQGCGSGKVMKGVNDDGTPNCVADVDTNTTYTAGAGLSLNSGVFSLNTTGCAAGEVLKRNSKNDGWECVADTDTDTNTTYTGDKGVTLTGTEFSADTSFVQKRVSGTCGTGKSIRVIKSDGTVTCETDTDTTYSAGTGLSLSGTKFNLKYPSSSVIGGVKSKTCSNSQFVRKLDTSGSLTCATDANTTYSAGTGMNLAGTTFSLKTPTSTVIGGIKAKSCPSGQLVKSLGTNGSVSCATDANSGGDITKVTAGTGLTGGASSGDATLAIDIDSALSLNDNFLTDVKAIQLKDWDDDTGGSDTTYRLLARDGAIQAYNGGFVVGSYNNGTWTDLADGTLIVEGKVGVGVLSPSEKVEVDGTVKATAFEGAFDGDGSALTNLAEQYSLGAMVASEVLWESPISGSTTSSGLGTVATLVPQTTGNFLSFSDLSFQIKTSASGFPSRGAYKIYYSDGTSYTSRTFTASSTSWSTVDTLNLVEYPSALSSITKIEIKAARNSVSLPPGAGSSMSGSAKLSFAGFETASTGLPLIKPFKRSLNATANTASSGTSLIFEPLTSGNHLTVSEIKVYGGTGSSNSAVIGLWVYVFLEDGEIIHWGGLDFSDEEDTEVGSTPIQTSNSSEILLDTIQIPTREGLHHTITKVEVVHFCLNLTDPDAVWSATAEVTGYETTP